MSCKQFKSQIALWVGNDLDDSSVGSVQRHLAVCDDCRRHWQAMKSCFKSLQRPRDEPPQVEHRALWPRMAPRIAQIENARQRQRFNGWAAAASVIAACCVLVTYAITYQPPPRQSSFSSMAEPAFVQPVQMPNFGLQRNTVEVSNDEGIFLLPDRDINGDVRLLTPAQFQWYRSRDVDR